MTALSTLVESLKRELAVPGLFEDAFPDSDDESLAATLADAFAEAQLWGFFPTMSVGPAPDYDTSADLSPAGGALVVLMASTRVLRAWMRTLNNSERYKAGPVEFETTRGVNLLRDELAYLRTRIDKLIEDSVRQRRAAAMAVMYDNYTARQTVGGYFRHELRG